MDNHPTNTLLFFVTDPVGPDVADRMRRFVDSLGHDHSWTAPPPEYVYEIDSEHDTREGDEPIVTCGGALTLRSIEGPMLDALPKDVARGELADAEYLVDRLEALSAECGYTLELEVDGTWSGAIQDGHAGKSVRVGLLDEWRKAIEGAH